MQYKSVPMKNSSSIMKLVIAATLLVSCLADVFSQKNMIFKFSNDLMVGKDFCGPKNDWTFASEYAVELPLWGDWNQDYTFNFPSVGFAITPFYTMFPDSVAPLIKNGDISEWTVATYAYFKWPFIHTPRFAANLKLGSGLALYPKELFKKDNWNQTDAFTVLSRNIVALYNGGLDFNIRLGKAYGRKLYQWEIAFGGDIFAMSSFGINRKAEDKIIWDAYLGARYTPNMWPFPLKNDAEKKKKILALEFELTGGVNQLDVDDGSHYYPDFSFCARAALPLSNAYRIGLFSDVFFNSIYNGKDREINRRYNFIEEDKFKNKLRVGVGLSNDFTFYRFTLGLECGFYVYKPWKVPEEDDLGNPNKNYKLENLMYQKLTTKYYFTDNWYGVGRVKTHLLQYENVEMGIGYAIPDFGSRLKSNPFKRLKNPFKRKEDYTEIKIQGERNRYYTPRKYDHPSKKYQKKKNDSKGKSKGTKGSEASGVTNLE
jgi:hypothetical protein